MLPGHVVDRDRLGQRQRVLAERLHLLARVAGEGDEDEGLHRDAERARLDDRPVAGEDALLAQPPHPLEAARRGEPDPGRELLVRQPSIVLQGGQYGEVRSVQGGHLGHFSEVNSIDREIHRIGTIAAMKKPNDARPGALSLDTLAVHAGREDFGEIGVHAPPLDLSTTYPTGDLADATASIDAMAKGGAPTGSFVYARFHNPTVARYEAALASLEGAEAAVAFASGHGRAHRRPPRRARAREEPRGRGPAALRRQRRAARRRPPRPRGDVHDPRRGDGRGAPRHLPRGPRDPGQPHPRPRGRRAGGARRGRRARARRLDLHDAGAAAAARARAPRSCCTARPSSSAATAT